MERDKKLWGGRFKKEIDKDFFEFQKSIQYDYKLAEYDIYHSLIHVQALTAAGILKHEEEQQLLKALREILSDVKNGAFKPDLTCEDIHSDIQNRVGEKVGKLAAKLHTLRSRNDQVVFDEKLYVLNQYLDFVTLISDLLNTIYDKSKEYPNRPFVGYTHTQRAQVILFSDYMLAYGEMFLRDYERFTRFEEGLKVFIGAGALAGSSLDPAHYRRAFSMSGLLKKNFEDMTSPLDHVSSRDFIVEFLSILAVMQMNLSRFAEDMILYSTREYDYLDLPEEFCTGSSLMPHKKNADFMELVRGYTGRVYGNLMAVLTTMKGLPLAYNRDMQLDKEPMFSSVDILKSELKIMIKFVAGIRVKEGNVDRALEDESFYATELAEYLVSKMKVPFKDAHDIVGRLIRHCQDKNAQIKKMSDKALSVFHKGLTNKIVIKVMNAKYAIVSKKRSGTRKLEKIKKVI
jgi:argininosuccinate lyase